MKKKFILPFLTIFALTSCKVKIEENLTSSISTSPTNIEDKVDKDLVYLRDIASLYNEDESLSFYNYFTNALNLPIYNDNTIIHNNKVYKIEGQDVSFKEEYLRLSYLNEEDDISALNTKNYKLSDIVYIKNLDTAYEIVNDNLGLDIALENALYARPIAYKGVINGKALGIKPDIDNSQIFINIFNSLKNYNINTLILDGKTYLCNNRISLNNQNDFTILGNNSTILVNDSYNDSTYGEFFFNITGCTNILFSKLNFTYDMTRSIDGIKTQLGVHSSKNIEILASNYLIPDTVLTINNKNREFTNMDLYSNWENVIINNCSFTNLCDSEAGGSLWIRDFWQKGSKNCKVLNSTFYKIAHDEILAVFSPGKIDNVLIKGNTFTIPDDGASSSVMNFTLGTGNQHTNISFEDNKIDACSTGGLIWSKGQNVIIKNNDMKIHLSSKGTGNFRAVEAQATSDGNINFIEEFSQNRILVDSYLDNYNFQVHILHNIENVKNNEITINLHATDVMLNVNNISNNKIITNKYINYVLYNVGGQIKENQITLNYLIGTVFRYYGQNLNANILITKNNIKYLYEEVDDSSCLIMLNGMKMMGCSIDFIGNDFFAKSLNSKSRTLFYAPEDNDVQTSKFIDNSTLGLNIKNNYLKNCEIQYE